VSETKKIVDITLADSVLTTFFFVIGEEVMKASVFVLVKPGLKFAINAGAYPGAPVPCLRLDREDSPWTNSLAYLLSVRREEKFFL
jgi:hypothetical protein